MRRLVALDERQAPARFHSIEPVKQWRSLLQAPKLRSQVRPLTYGPRSITGTVIVTPAYRNVTSVPHGSVRWATPTSALVRVCPHAVPWPYNRGPYHEMSAS
jgi:hypothetical protein